MLVPLHGNDFLEEHLSVNMGFVIRLVVVSVIAFAISWEFPDILMTVVEGVARAVEAIAG
jgi:hypothetical protein